MNDWWRHTMMDFEYLNIKCPKCGNGNYMVRMMGSTVKPGDELNCKCLNCNSYFNIDELLDKNEDEEPKLIAADLWYSDGTANTLTQIGSYNVASGKCDDGCINLTIKNAKLSTFIKYSDPEKAYAKLRDVNTCLKTLVFMLEQYILPDEKNNVTPFATTQEMAKYFKVLADICLNTSAFE